MREDSDDVFLVDAREEGFEVAVVYVGEFVYFRHFDLEIGTAVQGVKDFGFVPNRVWDLKHNAE